MKRNFLKSMKLAVALLAAATFLYGAASKQLEEKVRHELIILPYYDVFDNLAFRVEGDKVTLLGQVNRPTLRTHAEGVVKLIEGVATVDNQIEVLPVSGFDDQIRLATLRAVYGQSALFRYNLGAIAPIRIIVKNGNVTLEGVVASEMDKNIAYIAANGVFGAFSVTNNLRVSKA
jgi:hyperosmotically inducible protein